MKNSAAINFIKHFMSVLSTMAKSKSTAIKTKTEQLKARLMVLSLLKTKKFSISGLGTKAISHKIHALLGQKDEAHQDHTEDENKAIVLYNNNAPTSVEDYLHDQYQFHSNNKEILLLSNGYDDDDKYPDLTHSLFDEEEDNSIGDPNASAIDMVRNSKEEEGQDFVLEDEINNVADVFIKKFHKRMRLQKLESFKRYQEMLQRST